MLPVVHVRPLSLLLSFFPAGGAGQSLDRPNGPVPPPPLFVPATVLSKLQRAQEPN